MEFLNNIPTLTFENLPEKSLKFDNWKQVHDWAQNECKEWEHWYDYISEMPSEITQGINSHRGPMVQLWSKTQKLINVQDLKDRDYTRFSRMAEKEIERVNLSNPIISYSELGQKMIKAMDENPDNAIADYSKYFLRNDTTSVTTKNSQIQKSDILNLVKFRVKREKVKLFNSTFLDYGNDLLVMIFEFISETKKGDEIEFVIKFYNEKTGFKDSITKRISSDKLEWFNDFFEKIDERIYYNIIEEYLYELNYPKDSIKIEYKLFNTNNRTDISILHNDKIIAIIEIKKENKRKYPNIHRAHTEQLNKYYNTIISNQNIIPKMFLVFFYDSFYTFYEYDIRSNKIEKVKQFPNYSFLIKDYKEIEIAEDDIKLKISRLTYTSFDNDQINSKKDYIDISNDINAFAKLIAYKDLNPPLSIALFGKWGSGKSTFMDLLEERIGYFANLNNTKFCTNVSHIKFNAWHYSDTNLWASLVSHIFKELDKYINKDKNEQNRISIYTQLLDSQKEKLREKRLERIKLKKEFLKNTRKIKSIENKKTEILIELNQLKFDDIKKEILKDEGIQQEFKKITNDENIKYGKNLSEIQSTYNELKTTFGTYKKVIWLLFNNKEARRHLFIFSLVFIVLLIGVYYFIEELKILIGLISSIVIGGKVFIDQYLQKIKPITETLDKFLKSLENKEALIKENKKLEINKELEFKNKQIKKIENDIFQEEKKIDNVIDEIKKIKSGEYLANFISDRSSSDDYKQHLGLVSVIREDFDNLKQHLSELNQDAKYNIERIVLYVDDLDRCPDDTVIKVLEAIHLLLAFDLFVVVVSVDSRWVTSSLVKERGLSIEEDGKATPYDYLEKIFQIPFKIKPLAETSKKSLIHSLLQNDKEENQKKNNGYVESSYVEDGYIENSNAKEKIDEIMQKPTEGNHVQEYENEVEKDEYTKMTFTKEEIEYMEILSSYIGDTPRTIKRFINIYRIVKNHDEIKTTMENYKDDYRLVFVILCIVFKNPKYLINSESGEENKVFSHEFIKIYEEADEIRKKQYVEFLLRFSFE